VQTISHCQDKILRQDKVQAWTLSWRCGIPALDYVIRQDFVLREAVHRRADDYVVRRDFVLREADD
jgi:hypothetical protein